LTSKEAKEKHPSSRRVALLFPQPRGIDRGFPIRQLLVLDGGEILRRAADQVEPLCLEDLLGVGPS
jgi:hypothetical protein